MIPPFALDRRPPQFVAWDHHQPAFLPDIDAVVRWAQARRLTHAVAWVLDDLSESARPVGFVREGMWWSVRDGHTYRVEADPSDDPRVLAVVDAVAKFTWRLGRVPPREWRTDDPRDVDGTYAPYGLLPPFADPLGFGWTVMFCPEIVAQQSAWMNDRDRAAYMTAIEMRLMLHVAHREHDYATRERIIEGELSSTGLLTLTTEVQVRVMERR